MVKTTRGYLRTTLALTVAITLASHATTSLADDAILWPSRGLFPAYPQQAAPRGVQVYGFANAAVDDNLFRLSAAVDPVIADDSSDDHKKGDLYAELGAGLRAALDWQRQQLNFDINASHYSFDRYSLLDEWLYDGHALWSWHAGDNFKGRVSYAHSRKYPDFAELQYASQDLVTNHGGQVGVDWRFLSYLELRTLLEATNFHHDDESRQELDNRVSAGTLGLFYVNALNTAVGVQYKVSDGDYPNREAIGTQLVDNQYRETESSLVIAKPFTVNVSLDLRVGYTQREHVEVPERDFSGTTGRLQLRYTPTAKVSLNLAGYRELHAVEDLDASYADARGGSIGPAWAPTSTIILQLAYGYEERLLAGDPGFIITATPPRKDHTRLGRFIAGYQPNEHVDVALTYEHGARTSNTVDADYVYNLVRLNCTVAL